MFNLVSRLIFPAPTSSYTASDFPRELIWLSKSLDPEKVASEDRIPCLLIQSPATRFVMLYLHGNAEDLGRCYAFCCLLRNQFQVHVLAVEYPGYGLCPGEPDEESVTENAYVGFRFIRETLQWPLDGIILFGRSIGTGPAITIGMKHHVYGVVLVSPFLSVQTLCWELIGPVASLLHDRFPNRDRIRHLTSLVLIVHGQLDTVVPVTHGRKLYASCRSHKMIVCPSCMDHNTNLFSEPSYMVRPMIHFFSLPDYSFEELKIPMWVFMFPHEHETGGHGIECRGWLCCKTDKSQSTENVVTGSKDTQYNSPQLLGVPQVNSIPNRGFHSVESLQWAIAADMGGLNDMVVSDVLQYMQADASAQGERFFDEDMPVPPSDSMFPKVPATTEVAPLLTTRIEHFQWVDGPF